MKITILGSKGFLGAALKKKLSKDNEVYSYLRPDVEVVFFFSSPSSQILFNYAPEYCLRETVQNFDNVLRYCKEKGIKLIYPSTVSENNLYADTKRVLEFMHRNSGYDKILCFKIAAGYGPGEKHKGEYASVVYQFIKEMKKGNSPVIYGDGSQSRDFVHIDDIVNIIVNNMGKRGFITIATGVNTSFKRLVKIINKTLGTNITPTFVGEPVNYLKHTYVDNYYACKISIEKGVAQLCG